MKKRGKSRDDFDFLAVKLVIFRMVMDQENNRYYTHTGEHAQNEHTGYNHNKFFILHHSVSGTRPIVYITATTAAFFPYTYLHELVLFLVVLICFNYYCTDVIAVCSHD